MGHFSAGDGRNLSLGFQAPVLGFRVYRAGGTSRRPTRRAGSVIVELNELNWDDMLKFGGIALVALIVLARLMMRG
jgi:hypothetical protein